LISSARTTAFYFIFHFTRTQKSARRRSSM
jgi:hypothetical protein